MIRLLGLLDLSAEFGTVDHQILFERLLYEYGLDGLVLERFKSYLTDRSVCVHYNGLTPETIPILYVVLHKISPRSSNLHPLRGGCHQNSEGYMGTMQHSYAYDLQGYDHSQKSSCTSLLVRMSTCIVEINEWMASNRLKLYPTKTEKIWLGSPQRVYNTVQSVNFKSRVSGIKPTTHVRDLGVMIDNDLSLQCHVNHITRTCFYHLRQLRVIRRSLTVDTAQTLVRSLVHSRLDYWNGVLAGMHQYQYDRLQSVLRAAVRLVMQILKWASVSEAMQYETPLAPVTRKGRVQTM